MGHSDRFGVFLHTTCSTFFSDSMNKHYGYFARSLPFVLELTSYQPEEIRNA